MYISHEWIHITKCIKCKSSLQKHNRVWTIPTFHKNGQNEKIWIYKSILRLYIHKNREYWIDIKLFNFKRSQIWYLKLIYPGDEFDLCLLFFHYCILEFYNDTIIATIVVTNVRKTRIWTVYLFYKEIYALQRHLVVFILIL